MQRALGGILPDAATQATSGHPASSVDVQHMTNDVHTPLPGRSWSLLLRTSAPPAGPPASSSPSRRQALPPPAALLPDVLITADPAELSDEPPWPAAGVAATLPLAEATTAAAPSAPPPPPPATGCDRPGRGGELDGDSCARAAALMACSWARMAANSRCWEAAYLRGGGREE